MKTRTSALRLLPLALVCWTLPLVAQNGSGSTQPLNLDPKRIESALSGMVNDGRAAGASVLIA